MLTQPSLQPFSLNPTQLFPHRERRTGRPFRLVGVVDLFLFLLAFCATTIITTTRGTIPLVILSFQRIKCRGRSITSRHDHHVILNVLQGK